MNIRIAQQWIHRVNTTAALVLLTTGVMHTLPELRSALIGGYDRLVAEVHIWTGAVFIGFPILAVLISKGSILQSIHIRVFSDPLWHWRRLHLTVTICVCLSQACAGTMIWLDTHFPMPISLVDAIFIVHQCGAWYIGLTLPIHLWMARKVIARTTRNWVGINL